MQSLIILGRQPALGLAELESLYGSDNISRVESNAALLDIDPARIDFMRLGGSIKLCRVMTTLDSTNWNDIETYLLLSSPKHAANMPEGKIQIGLSAYGLRVTTQRMLATGLSLKKAIKQTGRSVRLVPNKELALGSASVLHNHLTDANGWEIVFVRDGQKTIVARTVLEQDIASYTARDRDRPLRDARVGMLPPKLAQIIINLAVGNIHPKSEVVVLDPFCGTGVVLQEASLMGFSIRGSDNDARMIEYTDKNLQWLHKMFGNRVMPNRPDDADNRLEIGDATNHIWNPPPDYVASETYLGRPFTTLPSPEVLNQTASDCNLIIKKFLGNIRSQIPRGTRLCLAVPAWQTRNGQFKHLPFLGGSSSSGLDSLRDLGYNRISFEHARDGELVYYREGQIVARELLVMQKL